MNNYQKQIDYINENVMPEFAKQLNMQINSITSEMAELSIKNNKAIYRKTPITVGNETTSIYSLSGQAIMSIADTALVYAVIGKTGLLKNMVTVDATTQFLAPIMTDDINIKAKVLRIGKTLIRGQVDIYDGNNQLGATAFVNYMLLNDFGK